MPSSQSEAEHAHAPDVSAVGVVLPIGPGLAHCHALGLAPLRGANPPANLSLGRLGGPCHAVPLCLLDALCLGLALVGLARCCVCLNRPDQQQCCDQESPGGD